jgi:hypothetical protein
MLRTGPRRDSGALDLGRFRGLVLPRDGHKARTSMVVGLGELDKSGIELTFEGKSPSTFSG